MTIGRWFSAKFPKKTFGAMDGTCLTGGARATIDVTMPCQSASGPSPLLTLRQAAMLLGLHPNTIRNQVSRGIIPGTKIGGNWRFLEADLVAWIRSGYPEVARMQLSAQQKEALWHSSDVQTFTTSSSQHRTEQALDDLLAQPIGPKPKNITTG